jgi:hypothetical protein
MRIAMRVLGLVLLAIGCVWFLQGINVLPGSFMTGQRKWALYGALLGIVGLAVLILGGRRRS